jgi:apolipoprotein N-acyltransferase
MIGPVDLRETPHSRRAIWLGASLSLLSGALLAAAMPNYDMHLLAWVALVPLLLAITYLPRARLQVLTSPSG